MPAFGDRGAAAIAALVHRDLPRRSVRYVVAEAGGTVVGTTRLALCQEAGAGGVGPIAQAIGWGRTLRAALVLGLVAHTRLAPDEAYVEELAVSPTHRRQGIGRALLCECDTIAGLAGKRHITLWVAEGNTAGVALYRACGYGVARRRRTLRGRLFFGAPVALLMTKPLPAGTAIVPTDGTHPRHESP